MPFLQLLQRTASVDAYRNQARLQIRKVLWPMKVVSCALFMRPLSVGGRWKFGYALLQKTVSLLLTVFVTAASLAFVLNYGAVISAYYVLLLFDFYFLLLWNSFRYNQQLCKSLLRSTIGIGVVRKYKSIVYFRNIVFGVLATGCLILWLFCTANVAFLHNSYRFVPDDAVYRIVGCVAIVLVATASVVMRTVFCTFVAVVVAEFTTLGEDFSRDVNVNQVAVVKHYIRIHAQLYDLVERLSPCFNAWLSISGTLTAVNGIISVHALLDAPGYRILITLHSAMCWASFLLHVVCMQKLRQAFVDLKPRLLRVVTSERNVHDQTYWLCDVYIQRVRNDQFSLNFCIFSSSLAMFLFAVSFCIASVTIFIIFIDKYNFKISTET